MRWLVKRFCRVEGKSKRRSALVRMRKGRGTERTSQSPMISSKPNSRLNAMRIHL